jgi:hypothetical protein
MPYESAYDEQKALVRIRVYGPAPHQEHEAARIEAVRLCSEHGCKRLLVDLRDLTTEKIVTTLSCFDFGTECQDVALPESTRSAIVMPTDSEALKDVTFTINVALNRGVIIRSFQSVPEAEAWLLGND